MDYNALKTNISLYLDSLKNFQFSFFNPLFWGFWLLLFLVLLRFWDIKKSFSFSLTIAIVLLATTKLEGLITDAVIKAQGTFDPLIIRALSLIVILFISLYYFFIRRD